MKMWLFCFLTVHSAASTLLCPSTFLHDLSTQLLLTISWVTNIAERDEHSLLHNRHGKKVRLHKTDFHSTFPTAITGVYTASEKWSFSSFLPPQWQQWLVWILLCYCVTSKTITCYIDMESNHILVKEQLFLISNKIQQYQNCLFSYAEQMEQHYIKIGMGISF
jgi:hypothetical protein